MIKRNRQSTVILLAGIILAISSIGIIADISFTEGQVATTDAGIVEWKYSTITNHSSSSLTFADGKVYFVGGNRTGSKLPGSQFVNRNASVYSLDSETGEEIWRLDVGSDPNVPSFNSVTVHDEVVYFHGDFLYAIDAHTGNILWKKGTDDGYGYPTAATGNTVYTGFVGGLRARDSEVGRELWTHMGGEVTDVATAKGAVVYTAIDGSVYFMNASTGEKVWEYQALEPPISPLSVSVNNGTVYVKYKNGSIHSVDAEQGEVRWIHNLGIGTKSDPWVSDGTVYINGNDVYALNAQTGKVEWKYSTNIPAETSPTVINKSVYAGYAFSTANTSHVFALDGETGQLEWEVTTGKKMYDGNRPIVNNGTLYVGTAFSMNGTVYAFNLTALKNSERKSYDITDGQELSGFGFLLGVLAVILIVVIFIRVQGYRE